MFVQFNKLLFPCQHYPTKGPIPQRARCRSLPFATSCSTLAARARWRAPQSLTCVCAASLFGITNHRSIILLFPNRCASFRAENDVRRAASSAWPSHRLLSVRCASSRTRRRRRCCVLRLRRRRAARRCCSPTCLLAACCAAVCCVAVCRHSNKEGPPAPPVCSRPTRPACRLCPPAAL